MKKLIAVLLIAATAMLTLASCSTPFAEEGDVTVVIDNNGTYEVYMTYLQNVENKSEGALGVLQNLKHRPENPLHLKYTVSTYGAFLTEIGSIKEDAAAGYYIMIYTSVETDSYFDAATVTYGDAILHMSGVGLNLMQVSAGAIFLFRAEKFSF